MTYREPVKVLADVLKAELGLDDGHLVLKFQDWGIPQDNGLYIALWSTPLKPIGNNNYFDGGDDTADPPVAPTEVQEVVMADMVQIDAMSLGSSAARLALPDILMALASQACLRAQGMYQMKIASIPQEFQDLSALEETTNLQRFTTTLIVTSIKTKTKAASFYDTIPQTEAHFNVR
jgi:hypothetical protein